MRLVLLALACSSLGLFGACNSTPKSPSAASVLDKPSSGFVQVEGGRVAYRVHGEGTRTPLLVLHGGPGIPHDYLANLADLGDERPVVFYDQLGCGLSDRPDDPSLWTRERFASEIDAVRRELGLEEVVLYGHSWGSILAVDYLTGIHGALPTGVRAVVLAGPALSVPRFIEDTRRMIDALPAEAREAILEGERTGKTDSEPYQAAAHLFYRRHICRRDPWPAELDRAFATMGTQVYAAMNGPTEFTVTGPLASVDLTPRLGELGVPVLYTCGEHDEMPPETTRAYAALTPDSEVVVIAGAAHLPNFDRPEEYLAAVREWLGRKDGM